MSLISDMNAGTVGALITCGVDPAYTLPNADSFIEGVKKVKTTVSFSMKKNKTAPRYELEAIVSFDDRGQLVIPKDLRKKFSLKAGDKFALISCVQCDEGDCCSSSSGSKEICCFTLVSTKQIQGILPSLVGHALPSKQ